jgi:hypothetical protein
MLASAALAVSACATSNGSSSSGNSSQAILPVGEGTEPFLDKITVLDGRAEFFPGPGSELGEPVREIQAFLLCPNPLENSSPDTWHARVSTSTSLIGQASARAEARTRAWDSGHHGNDLGFWLGVPTSSRYIQEVSPYSICCNCPSRRCGLPLSPLR